MPPFTEQHEQLRAEIRAFVAEKLRPHAAEWEKARLFPDVNGSNTYITNGVRADFVVTAVKTK
jgi:alkylation response protein AidB-like acyl-CoA dehydrogenase